MSFDSIVNRAEYFSEHYLEALVQADLRDLRSRWDAAEGAGTLTSRKAVRALGPPFFAAKADAIDGDGDALAQIHDAVLKALGFAPEREVLQATHGETIGVAVPVAHVATSETGTEVIVVEAAYAADADDILGDDGALLEPLDIDGERVSAPSKAIPALFALDEPPRHVLVLAGLIVLLGSREKWAEGRFLAVDLDLALGRGDMTARGELETVAALFSRDALVPVDGEAVIDRLGAASHKHAVGVSADLREGVRRSVEDIANAVVQGRLERKLAVYDKPDIERDLARESLRFLYRILFLLYAEARPETGVLPTTADGYEDGYGLDRLRELALTELTTEDARAGSHLHDSLDLLFGLVNNGYHHEFAAQQLVVDEVAADDTGLIFEPLQSELFAPRSTPLIDSVRLRNEVLRRVLARLLMTREKSGRDRQFVSYSTLGINQLGAVYEGLMAYTGFLAGEALYEVRRPGAGEGDGTWVVPVAAADEYPADAFVTTPGGDGAPATRVRHEKGSFVYRLSGRDRQRSASYYTPEVLTRCVVRHALAELLDQDGETTPADRVLELTVCEPALGSGAFLNEAINQLAADYLRRKESELDEVIDPEEYPRELQRVKAHIALHQCYGVDLNATAIELAEVSLWLNAMHPGLRAPWFGLRLRRGNSLVGARRAVYAREQLKRTVWLKAAPADRPLLGTGPGDGEVHHFLLPAAGWGAAAAAKQAKELAPEAAKALADWRKAATAAPSPADVARLVALAARVEALWALAGQRLALAERDLRRPIQLFGQPAPPSVAGASRAAVEAALKDEDSGLARLRLVMDAWCALWFWPLTTPQDVGPPTRSEWLDALERLLGVDPRAAGDEPAQVDIFTDLAALEDRERELAGAIRIEKVADVVAAHSWLTVVREIAESEGFFRWELEFTPVFDRGGFDLQVGNPPWVRPRWLDDLSLAELNPWFGLEGGAHVEFDARRDAALADEGKRAQYLDEATSAEALTELLGAATMRPELVGLQLNMYMVFMTETWRRQAPDGVVGLLHPEGHFVEPKGGVLRRVAYARLRRHWHFVNEARLFEEVDHHVDFGVHVYGTPSHVAFRMLVNAQIPETVDGSLAHDGTGDVPGIKTPDGRWDLRPHADRVLDVDPEVLASWALLFDEPGTAGGPARAPAHAAGRVRPRGAGGDAGAACRPFLPLDVRVSREEGEDRRDHPPAHRGSVLMGRGRASGSALRVEQSLLEAAERGLQEQPRLFVVGSGDVARAGRPADELPARDRARGVPGRPAALGRHRFDELVPGDLAPHGGNGRSPFAAGRARSARAASRPHLPYAAACERARHSALGGTLVQLATRLPLQGLRQGRRPGRAREALPVSPRIPPLPRPAPAHPASQLPDPRLRAALARSLRGGLHRRHLHDKRLTPPRAQRGHPRVDDGHAAAPRPASPPGARRARRARGADPRADRRSALRDLPDAVRRAAQVRVRHALRRRGPPGPQRRAQGPCAAWAGAELGRYVLPFTAPDREAEMRVAYAEFERRAGGAA